MSNITLDELRAKFHLNIVIAKHELSVSETSVKKSCRKLGIPRWPYRQLKGLCSYITLLEYVITVSNDPQRYVNKLESVNLVYESILTTGVVRKNQTNKFKSYHKLHSKYCQSGDYLNFVASKNTTLPDNYTLLEYQKVQQILLLQIETKKDNRMNIEFLLNY